MKLIAAVESEDVPDESILAELQADLRRLAPSMLIELRSAGATGDAARRIEELAGAVLRPEAAAPLAESGVHEFRSSRDPKIVYRVTYGRGGHLECTCEGFRWRGACKHVREVRAR